MQFLRFGLLLLAVLFIFTGCSSSDDDESVSAVVTNFEVNDSTLSVGEGSVASVEFSFSSNAVFDDDKNLVITLRLPSSLRLREGTSEIDGVRDESVGAQITNCPATGEQFLVFDLDRFDLEEASNPNGDADARLTLTVDAIQAQEIAIVGARADGDIPIFACGLQFPVERELAMRIVP